MFKFAISDESFQSQNENERRTMSKNSRSNPNTIEQEQDYTRVERVKSISCKNSVTKQGQKTNIFATIRRKNSIYSVIFAQCLFTNIFVGYNQSSPRK